MSSRDSNAIEGIRTTDDRVLALLAGGTKPRGHSEDDILGYGDALRRIHAGHGSMVLSKGKILELYGIMTSYSSVEEPHFKERDNVIVERDADGRVARVHETVPFGDVDRALDDMLASFWEARNDGRVNSLLLIPCFIVDFLRIHPFEDGNGRMSRLLTALLLHQEGYDICRYVSLESRINATRDRYYDALAQMTSDKKLAANWVMGEVSAAVKQTEGITFENSKVSPSALCGLLKRIKDGTLSGKGAKTVFAALWSGEGDDVDALIEAKGLKQISDASALAVVIEEVLAKNQKSVGEFLSGKEKALNALVGQCMKATKGKANPSQLKEMLIQKIKG